MKYILFLQSYIWKDKLETAPIITSCVSTLCCGVPAVPVVKVPTWALLGKSKPCCPYMHLNVHTKIHSHKQIFPCLQHNKMCTYTHTHTHWTTGFLCNDRHSSPTAYCRSDDLPFHITLHSWVRHKHDIAPNHTDGEADRPTDMDVDDVYIKKSHNLSDADAMTQHIYSSLRLWECRHGSLEPWWGCQSWRLGWIIAC